MNDHEIAEDLATALDNGWRPPPLDAGIRLATDESLHGCTAAGIAQYQHQGGCIGHWESFGYGALYITTRKLAMSYPGGWVEWDLSAIRDAQVKTGGIIVTFEGCPHTWFEMGWPRTHTALIRYLAFGPRTNPPSRLLSQPSSLVADVLRKAGLS